MVILTALTFFLLALLAYVAFKARRIHLKLFDMQRELNASIDNHFSQVEALLNLRLELGLALGLQPTRGWAGSPDFLLQVFRSARRAKPQTIVECSSGISTVVLAQAARLNGSGHVWSLDHEPKYAQLTRDELARHGLEDWATVVDAPLVPTPLDDRTAIWYDTSGLEVQSIDLLVIDGPPKGVQPHARLPAVPVLQARLQPGAQVMLDDADRPDERDAIRLWVERCGLHRIEVSPAEKGLAVLRMPLAVG